MTIERRKTSRRRKRQNSLRARRATVSGWRDLSCRHFQNVEASGRAIHILLRVIPTALTLHSDLAGIDSILQDIRELIEYPLTHPEIYAHIGIDPPRGILLHGPPGCGKTLLAKAVGGEIGVPLLNISAPEVVSGMSGESEEKLRKLFDDAVALAPSIIFIDEIDAITGKRDSSTRGMERRIVAQLQTCMDSLNDKSNQAKPVMIIGATNRPDALDSALRRAGRFDREIALGIPDEAARRAILILMTRRMKISGDIDYDALAAQTPGYVGADLSALTYPLSR